jgi:hypothetical protein
MTGAVRRNRNRLPLKFKRKFTVGEKMYCRSGPLLVCAFWEKELQKYLISLLSSKAVAKDATVTHCGGRIKAKPQI